MDTRDEGWGGARFAFKLDGKRKIFVVGGRTLLLTNLSAGLSRLPTNIEAIQ